MEILEVKEQDKVCTVTFEATDEECNLLLREGIRAFIREEGLKVMVLAPSSINVNDEKVKKYELSDDEAQFLTEKGFNSLLRQYIDQLEVKEAQESKKITKRKKTQK